jgi:hypothetical protein
MRKKVTRKWANAQKENEGWPLACSDCRWRHWALEGQKGQGTVPIAGLLAASLTGGGIGARVDSGAYGKNSTGGGFGRGDHHL